MFLSYIFCRTGRAGRNSLRVIKTSKYVYLFCNPGGAGGNFAQVLLNWQIETVNWSVKVCMHSTRNKCTAIHHHLLQYKRHMENIGTKTRHKKGNKVYMFGA